jgi:hypothetical protein
MWERFKTPVKATGALIATGGATTSIFIWLDVKPKDVSVWPRWVWLILAIFLLAVAVLSAIHLYRLFANRRSVKHSEKLANFGNFILADSFAAWGEDLQRQLELLWHHWNNSGEVLLYPIAAIPPATEKAT